MSDQTRLLGAEHTRQEGARNKFFRHLKTFINLTWPHKKIGLQLNMLVCIVILAATRLLVLGVPRYSKLVSE